MNWEFIGKYLPLYERAAVLTRYFGGAALRSNSIL